MKPEKIGRVLGIGVRVAGRIAWYGIVPGATPRTSQMQANAQVPGTGAASSQTTAQAGRTVAQAGLSAAQMGRGAAQGIGGLVRPFTRVGGILWLEITGGFFLLPAVVFAPTVWRTRASWAAGPDHRTFLASAIVVTVFFYLGVSSFWQARRKSRS